MKPTLFETVAEIIDVLGGSGVVARMFECGESAVGNWRVQNQFPAHTYELITEELARLGYGAPKGLWKFHRKKSAMLPPLAAGVAR
jgi:hypothetical protein